MGVGSPTILANEVKPPFPTTEPTADVETPAGDLKAISRSGGFLVVSRESLNCGTIDYVHAHNHPFLYLQSTKAHRIFFLRANIKVLVTFLRLFLFN